MHSRFFSYSGGQYMRRRYVCRETYTVSQLRE